MEMNKSMIHKMKTSIGGKVIIFSGTLFLVLLIGGSIAFSLSMWQIRHTNVGIELSQSLEIERIKLEASVNGEIALALKMATSPLIVRHFLNPEDAFTRRMAFDEIAGYKDAFKSKSAFWASDIDKEFYFDENNHYKIDTENPDNYWYKMTLYETEKYNFNINYNPELKKIMLWINAPVFDNGKPIGLVGTGIDLSDFVNSIFRDYKGSAKLYFFNALNEITGAQDLKLVTDKAVIDTALGATGKGILAKSKELTPGEIKYFNAPLGEVAVGEVPALGWYIVGIQPLSFLDSFENSMTILFFTVIAVIAIIFVIFYLYITSLISPMNNMIQALDQISADWDMTKRLAFHQHDEIGKLGDFFNMTFEKMRALLTVIKGKTVTLSETGEELTFHMNKTKMDIDGINKNVQYMREQVLSQADKVNATTNSIEIVIKGLDELNEHIAAQSETLSKSSASIEEMVTNVQSVTETLIKNTVNIQSLADSSQAGRTDLQKVSADIKEIAKESEGLLEINMVIQTIASQTNLLSMNAAIEAAHAGELGQGFAVIAGEISKLADNSRSQSKTISAVLKKIKLMIDTITKSTGAVLERINEIQQEVQVVSDQETQIRNSMVEHEKGSQEILEAVTQLNTATELVKKTSEEVTGESRDILNQSSELKQITTDSAGNMDDMSVSIDEIACTISRVQEISDENKENIDSVSVEIGRFKVE
ncbi:MAG: methyl-accepting chemotaxis protein [Spirochaetes bacterium]|nr:methyl-accepting chemotaxis protein [Spirochaetota bacterium]